MRRSLLLFLLICSAVISASAELPQHLQNLVQKRTELKSGNVKVAHRVKRLAAAENNAEYENIHFTYASISYMGKYETEDWFGDVVELSSYYLTLSTTKPNYLGYLVDEGIQVDIMIYGPMLESEELSVPTDTYLPAPLFEESEGTFDTLFPEMTVNIKTDGSDELTALQFSFLEEGSIVIAATDTPGEYTISLNDMQAVNNETDEEMKVTGSYTGNVFLYNDDPSRCDILPANHYEMSIPNMRSTFDSEDNLIKLDFYGTPMSSTVDRPGATAFPCGAGDYFTTILNLTSSPYTAPDAFATTYNAGTTAPSTYISGFWNYNPANGLGMAYGTYLAIYDDDVRATYAFATQGAITVERTDTDGVYNFIINVRAENGAEMTGTWRGKIDGTAVPETSSLRDGIGNPTDAPVEYFNMQGVKVDHPTSGLYLMRKGNTVTKVVK